MGNRIVYQGQASTIKEVGKYSKKGPQTIEYDMHRFDQFIHLIVERVRRKLKVRIAVECFRQMNDYYVVEEI